MLDALARLHEARGDWDATAEALRARAAAASTDDDPAELVLGQLRLAEICEERLGRPDEAAASYHTVLSIDPGHRGALAALGRLHARASDWGRLLETFLAERAAAPDARERAHRCFKAAEVLEERLGRVPEAIDLYAEALALEPTLLPAHQALERLYERIGAHEALAGLLESDLATTSDAEERVAVLFRLARLHEDQLGDLEAAAGACERILALAPDHLVALRALAALRERAGRFDEVVALHDRLASITSDSRKAIALLQRSAEVQEEQLGDDAAAAATHERVLRLDPTHLPALRALGRLYARAGRWTDLVAMCRAEAEASFSTESAAALHFRVGEILEQRLGQEGEAIAAHREVLTLSPSHVGALRALARLYRAHGEWESLVEVLTADAAARAAPDRKAALLGEVAEILETRLGDLDRAAEVHAEVLRAAAGSGPSLRALDRILSARGRWAELASLRRAHADHERGPARVASLLRAAALLADRAGDAAGAEEACRAALAEAPGHAGALLLLSRVAKAQAEAREALAARAAEPRDAAQLLVAAALDRVAEGGDGAADLARAAALAPSDPVAGPLAEAALRRSGDHGALAELLAARRAAEPGAPSRALWAQQEGEAWEDAGDAGRARTAYEESLRLAPGALPALRGLRRVHARTGAWREVREQLQVEGASLRDPALAAAAFAEAGELAL
ncbi:MAG TPA: tetratricopeptide repeat protein, partial [Anaeromyxobacteraceae bacterium]